MANSQPSLEDASCQWVVDTSQQLEQRLGKPFKGVIWRGSANLADKVLGQDGSKMAFNGTALRGRLIKALDGSSWVSTVDGLFLPEDVEGSRVLWFKTDCAASSGLSKREGDEDRDWVVDTTRALEAVLGRNLKGVVWRASMDFEDKAKGPDDSKMALNGMHVRGCEFLSADGSSWVKLNNGLYLPKIVQGACVLWPKSETSTSIQDLAASDKMESSGPSDACNVSIGQVHEKSLAASAYISRAEKEAIDEVQCAMSQGVGLPLQSAILRAEDHGVGDEILEPARQVMKTLLEREAAVKALASAMHNARLQEPSADVPSSPSDGGALTKGASWLRTTFGRGGSAGSTPLPARRADMALLRGAVARADQAGVSQHLLVEARQVIVVVEERIQATSALEAAMKHGDEAVLRLAVARAKRAGVDSVILAKAAEALEADADADEVSHTSSRRRNSHPCIIDCPDTPVSRTAIDATVHEITAVVPFGIVDDSCPVFDGSVEVLDYDRPHQASGPHSSVQTMAQVSGLPVDRSAVPPRPPSAGTVGRHSTAWEEKEMDAAPLQPPQPPEPGQRNLRTAWAEGSEEESSGSEDSMERAITDGALQLLQCPPPKSCACLPYARLTDDAFAVLPAQTS